MNIKKALKSLKSMLKYFIANILIPKKSSKLVKKLFNGQIGLEIGGVSQQSFSKIGFLPIYPIAKNIDNCTFSSNTIWEGTLREGFTFAYDPKKQLGYQHIMEGSILDEIPSEKYDFILSSHVLEHIANPIKAVQEWLRVLKPNGYMVIVVPNKVVTFDHRRPTTEFSHLLEDYNNQTSEEDLIHLPEILNLHDLERDPAAGNFKAFKERSLKNIENRCLHHHVFDLILLKGLIDYLGLELILLEESTSIDILAIVRKVK